MTSTERSIFPYHMRSIAFHNMHTLHQHHRLSLPCCCPPRLLRNGRMSPSADVYSFGILSEWDLLLLWAWQFASLPQFACFFSSSTTGSRLHLCTRSSATCRICFCWLQIIFQHTCPVEQHGCVSTQRLASCVHECTTHFQARDVLRCAVWETYCGKQAWQGLHYGVVVERVVIQGERPPVPEDMPEELELLMRRCWDAEPANRPSFDQVGC